MYLGLGEDVYSLTAPSGQRVSIDRSEEAEIVKSAIEAKIMDEMTMDTEIKKSAISAIGNALGFALGGLLVGWILGKAARE